MAISTPIKYQGFAEASFRVLKNSEGSEVLQIPDGDLLLFDGGRPGLNADPLRPPAPPPLLHSHPEPRALLPSRAPALGGASAGSLLPPGSHTLSLRYFGTPMAPSGT